MNPVNKNKKVDLLVVGGGVLGTFHAYHALQRGLSVLLLERSEKPSGATVRNFGQVVPSGLDQNWQKFGRDSLRIYNSLQRQLDISVRQLGSVYLASNEDELTLLEELHEINTSNDYSSQLLTTQQCVTRYPQLRPSYCRGGLFFPQELSVNPRLLIHRLHDYLAQQPNYQSSFRSCIREIETNTDGSILGIATDGRTFKAAKAIICCGSEFQTLYPDRFNGSGMELVKLQMLRLKPLPQVTLPGNILTGLSIRRYESFAQCRSWPEIKSREPSDSFAKKWGVHILFKQEADGGIILGDSHEYTKADHPAGLDFDIRADLNQYFVEEGKRILDLPSWEIESSWFGIYCQTPDPSGIYVNKIGDNVHIVTGIGGKGMTSSAGFAEHHLGEIYND